MYVYIYGISFSIPLGAALGRRLAHDECVSCVDSDDCNRWLLSGSWDKTVKLWECKSSAGVVSALPVAEFYDSESGIVAVALEPTAGRYAAAGNEEGQLIVWDIKLLAVTASLQISPSNRYVSRCFV